MTRHERAPSSGPTVRDALRAVEAARARASSSREALERCEGRWTALLMAQHAPPELMNAQAWELQAREVLAVASLAVVLGRCAVDEALGDLSSISAALDACARNLASTLPAETSLPEVPLLPTDDVLLAH